MNTLTNPQFFVIPQTLSKHLDRNKINTIDALVYSKLRSVTSLDDLARLCFLNEAFDGNPLHVLHDRGTNYTIGSLLRLFETTHPLTDSQRTEYFSTIVPLSQSAPIAESVTAELSVSQEELDNNYRSVESDLYTVTLLNNNVIAVLLRHDFLLAVRDKQVLLDFMRECLKYLYMVQPIASVSRTALFENYVKELKVAR